MAGHLVDRVLRNFQRYARADVFHVAEDEHLQCQPGSIEFPPFARIAQILEQLVVGQAVQLQFVVSL